MRTTLVIDDVLYRRVKAKAAMEGRTVTDLVEAGLRTVVDRDNRPGRARAKPAWLQMTQGISRDPGFQKEMRRVEAAIEEAFEHIEPEEDPGT